MDKLNDNNQPTYFLATTALEEFWDTSQRLLFLGYWCCRYSRKDRWQAPENQVMPCPWDDPDRFRQAYNYLNEVHERLLSCLTETMNGIHRTRHSERYWRILLGPWLMHYLQVLYDRYISLVEAYKKYPDLTTLGLSEECFVTPRDTRECITLLLEDPYNLQIITRILQKLGKAFPQKPQKISKSSGFDPSVVKNLKSRVLDFFSRLPFPPIGPHTIISGDPNSSGLTDIKLSILARGKLKTIRTQSYQVPALPLDLQARDKLNKISLDNNEFESLLVDMLPLDMPQCFIESFELIKREAKKIVPVRPQAVFSAYMWYFFEVFKQIAAIYADEGALIVGSQHGGNYGSIKYLPAEDHELKITDRYYTWGWTRANSPARIVPFYAGKLSGRKSLHPNNKKDGILFAVDIVPRYLNRANYYSYAFSRYLEWQLRFIDAIDSKLRKKVRCRQLFEDYGWDIKERWNELCNDIMLEDFFSVPFLSSLENCRLFVCDHLGTTFLEALSANKPCVLFWDPKIYELRGEAVEYYKLLSEMEILFHDPQKAAHKVNAIYEDVESWWNQPERQRVVRLFCRRFARQGPDSIKAWANEFINLSHEPLIKGVVNENV
jgi:putative transferase (TIGR04331 family)